MKHTNLDEWQKHAADHEYTVKQVQGFEQYEALDGDRVVGRWVGDYGTFEELQPLAEVDPATGEPLVTETNVTEVQS